MYMYMYMQYVEYSPALSLYCIYIHVLYASVRVEAQRFPTADKCAEIISTSWNSHPQLAGMH